MKKIIITLIILLLITGCGKDEKYIEMPDNGGMDGLTYTFTANSNNFEILTGNLYYKDVKKQILVTNIQLKKDIKIDKMKLSFTIGDKEYKTTEYDKSYGWSAEEFLDNIVLTDYTVLSSTSDSPFRQTTKKSIKEDLKIVVEHCYKNKCNEEDFEIKYNNA